MQTGTQVTVLPALEVAAIPLFGILFYSLVFQIGHLRRILLGEGATALLSRLLRTRVRSQGWCLLGVWEARQPARGRRSGWQGSGHIRVRTRGRPVFY